VTTKLTLYNGALLLCRERFLSSLTENREPRYLLDQVWDSGGVKRCLEEGQWHFAMRTQMLDFDPSIEPDFGYNRAFAKPTDWVLTSGVCSDEFFNIPLTQYTDEAGYWYCNLDVLYVRYVSNDTDYGMDMNKWPETFREFVEAHLASRIVGKLSGGKVGQKEADDARRDALDRAKAKAAMAEPTKFPAQGNWTTSRGSGRRERRSRGGLWG
jgi:hypothetical protein